jgi:hypothetical protein
MNGTIALKHESDIFKLRFVLNPFSFVFLLSGQEYNQKLRNQLQVIDRQLNMIRNEWRQAFPESQPLNFSRVLHDYSDDQQGFILWKDLVAERLF